MIVISSVLWLSCLLVCFLSYAASVGAKHYHSSAKQSKGVQELFLDLSKREWAGPF